MRCRAFFALALVVASVALLANAGVAAPAPTAVGVRQIKWAGLQMDIATVRLGGRFVVKAVQANRAVTSLQPVVRICGGCVVGVNGDFFNPSTRQPVGGVIVDGVVFRSPSRTQNQLTFGPDGRISAGFMLWQGRISFGSSKLPVAVNDPSTFTPVLYNRRFGPATPAGAAIELKFVPRPSTAFRLGQTMRLEYKGTHHPGSRFATNEVILAAPEAYAASVRQLQDGLRTKQVQATLDLATTPAAGYSLGANHILMRGGRRLPIGEHDYFADGRHPRTIFGWDGRGHVMLVTIGSAVPGRRAGVSLRVAARLVESLGVRNAVNLDGGGSSTFVSHGRVRNHPSDGRGRAVSNAWIVFARRAA